MEDLVERILELGLLAKGIIPEEDESECSPPVEENKEAEEERRGYIYWKAPSANYIRNILETLSAISDEVSFVADAEKLKTVIMDMSNISLISLEIAEHAFYEYVIEGEKVEFGLNLSTLLKVLPKKLKNSYMTFRYPVEGDRAEITIVDDSDSKQEFYIDTIKPFNITHLVPRLTFTGKARININYLYQIIKQIQNSDRWRSVNVTIAMNPDGITISSKSEFVKMSQTINRYDPSLYELEANSEIEATFTADYLSKFLSKARKLTTEAIIELSTNKPIKITLELPGAGLQYFQAPVITT